MDLKLEINSDFVGTNTDITLPGIATLMLTPPLDEDYWMFRVNLAQDQAILGFPKFSTIGIGFAQEKDWNTNLPYTCPAEQIYSHIKHNKKYDEITDEQCLAAIKMIQDAAKAFKQNTDEE